MISDEMAIVGNEDSVDAVEEELLNEGVVSVPHVACTEVTEEEKKWGQSFKRRTHNNKMKRGVHCTFIIECNE